MSEPTILRALGKYRILSVLGEGAMGTVYRGFDPVLDRPLAIKTLNGALLRDDQRDEFLARFRREAQAVARLSHPNIVTVHEYGEDQGVPYIAMELIEGRDLKALLRDHPRPGIDQALPLMHQLLDGLDYCHAQDVVHRDLKPANIFLLPSGRIKIGDFGVARVTDSDLTQYDCQIGTLGYMSPEQFLGQPADGRSDLFSAGVILYELLAGRNPIAGRRMVDAGYEPIGPTDPRLPRGIDNVLRKALAKKPEDRFQTAREFANALKRLDREPKSPAWRRRNMLTAVAVALVVVVGLLGWSLWEGYSSRSPPLRPGEVQLATQPPGAAIWLEERRLGVTPYRFELPAGHYDIQLKKDGYQELSASLQVEAGADMNIELPLVPSRD